MENNKMTDYTLLTKFRNKEEGEYLIKKLKEKGYSCYNFFTKPADPNNPEADPEEQMKNFESVKNFYNDEYFKKIFQKDLYNLQPTSTHPSLENFDYDFEKNL